MFRKYAISSLDFYIILQYFPMLERILKCKKKTNFVENPDFVDKNRICLQELNFL